MDPYRVSKRNELMGIWRDCMGYGYGMELSCIATFFVNHGPLISLLFVRDGMVGSS
jgi:hypothetical protein